MDPITHSLGGGLFAHQFNARRRRFFLFCFLGEAPDLDVFFAPFGPWAFVLQHRGLSHSLVGVVGQALFYSWLFKRWDSHPNETFFKRSALYSLPLIFHLFCDYLTSYGLPLLSPFSLKSYQADIITAVNFFPMFVMLLGFFFIKKEIFIKKNVVRSLWFCWGLYVGGSLGLKWYARKQVDVPLATAVSTALNPFDWSVVDDHSDQNNYQCHQINLLTGDKQLILVPKPPLLGPVMASRNDKLVQEFLHDNRWPSVRIRDVENGWVVDWGSLLFSSRGMVRGKVRTLISKDGIVLHSQRFFGFWNPDQNKS